MSQTITKEIQGKIINFEGVDDALVVKVNEMLESKIQRGVPLDKIIEEMAKFNYIATESGSDENYVEPTPSEETPSEGSPAPTSKVKKSGKKGKKAEKAAKPVAKGKKADKKDSASSDLKERALKIIESKVADGAETKDIVAAVQKELKISYANAYYYYGRVYKQKK